MASAPLAHTDTPATNGDRARGWSVLVAVLPLAVLAGLLAWPARLFRDGDTGWHLGAGDFILRTGTIPAVDPFSYSFRGAPWTAHEWLSEVLMSGAYRLAGWNGLTILFALLASGALLLIGRELLRFMPARWAVVALVLIGFTAVPLTLARPHLFGWVMFSIWLIVLLRAREQDRAPPWPALALMVLWANCHASYILGLAAAGLFTLEALLAHRRNPGLALRWAAWGLLAVVATALTPHGLQGFLYPLQVQDMKLLAIIEEWRPSEPLRDAPFLLYSGLFWLFVASRWRRVAPLRLLLLAGLFAMALMHVRHQALFAIAAPLVAAPLVGPAGTAPEMPWRLLVPVATLLVIARLLAPWSLPETAEFPQALIDRVPAALRRQPVFNDYSMGGPLIMRGIAPAIDGRADMYGDEFTFAHLAMQQGNLPKFRQFVARYGVRWTVLTSDSPLAAKLDHDPDWRRFAADDVAVIHIRTR